MNTNVENSQQKVVSQQHFLDSTLNKNIFIENNSKFKNLNKLLICFKVNMMEAWKLVIT